MVLRSHVVRAQLLQGAVVDLEDGFRYVVELEGQPEEQRIRSWA